MVGDALPPLQFGDRASIKMPSSELSRTTVFEMDGLESRQLIPVVAR